MEYVYAAMLLHASKQEINEANINSVMKSANAPHDEARVKALVAAIKNINIDEAIQKAAFAPAAAGSASAGAAKAEVKEEDTKKTEEEAAAGLGSLFG